jgi:hypothetical protein
MAKVSFDFDSTLSVDVVEDYAKRLVDEGNEVWIVTSRSHADDLVYNGDLYDCAERIGILKEHIHFCYSKDKSEFLKDKGFLWHLDDDCYELYLIRTDTDVFPIWRKEGNDWGGMCSDLIRIFKIKAV